MHRLVFAGVMVCGTAAFATAQGASLQPFGTNCSYNGQPLAMGTVGLPQIGTTFTLAYSGPNLANTLTIQPAIALGLATTNLPIPTSFLPQQPPGCAQLVTPDVIAIMPITTAGAFLTQLDVAVPNTPTLAGFQFAAQWFALAIQCGIILPCDLVALPTSDAVLATVGF